MTSNFTSPPHMSVETRAAVRFGSKAETLERLAPLIHNAHVLPLVYFSVAAWKADRNGILEAVNAESWAREPLIVRSSTAREDDPRTMLPGHYLSVADVRGLDALAAAIDEVIASYPDGDDDLVLVQPLLRRASTTGVVFTCDPNTGAPYLVVNYEDEGNPAAVTGGGPGELRMFYAWRHAPIPRRHDRMRRLAALSAELVDLLDTEGLDIEFAFDRDDRLYLLQVRPMVTTVRTDNHEHDRALATIAEKIRTAGRRHPHLRGRRTVFGVMPDWNPAEIVGTKPRPLALSLYRRLITDTLWAEQRARYGYRDVRGFPLLLDFHGLPYVDVRESCNSLIPAAVPDELAERLVDHYIDRIVEQPELHDKVEFDVIFSCYTFTVRQRILDQTGALFSAGERDDLVTALRSLTNDLMDAEHPARRSDAASIAALSAKLGEVRDSALDLPTQIYWLLEDCRRFGTLAFAGFARLGFVATELLRSLVAVGVLTDAEVTRLMASLDTVSNRMLRDRGTLSRAEFLRRYGFLRPGTYDIRSPRYDEEPDRYFSGSSAGAEPPAEVEPFRLPAPTMHQLDALLRQHRLDQDAYGLLAFIVSSIEARENSKFEFTRHLSEALTLLTRLGREVGMDTDDLSYISVDCVDQLYRGAGSPEQELRACAETGRRQYELTRRLVLPPLITGPEDVTSFSLPSAQPNYVTQRSVSGPVVVLGRQHADLRGAILLLPSGDPGYDWIFTEGIAGFVTRYGGANSHMAIRAHQFGVPAVIGAGEVLYEQWSAAEYLSIDCLSRRVEVVR
jgi:phosphohistidine swiveling domain-containing protein